jgi:hypothetical protein
MPPVAPEDTPSLDQKIEVMLRNLQTLTAAAEELAEYAQTDTQRDAYLRLATAFTEDRTALKHAVDHELLPHARRAELERARSNVLYIKTNPDGRYDDDALTALARAVEQRLDSW